MIETFAKLIPKRLLSENGGVFYSGRDAFSGHAPLYILGANPGSDPNDMPDNTIEAQIRSVLEKPQSRWSEYRDVSWGNGKYKPGKSPMQRRVLHLFSELGVDPGLVPSSNLVFCRSRRVKTLGQDINALIDECWPFHAAILESLTPAAIVCLGTTDVGPRVAKRVGATEHIDTFTEQNGRKWKSTAWQNPSGLLVFSLTHPGIVDWTKPETDPTPMVKNALRHLLPMPTK